MEGPSIWYHTFVAEEIIMPKLLGKEREKKERKEKSKMKERRTKGNIK